MLDSDEQHSELLLPSALLLLVHGADGRHCTSKTTADLAVAAGELGELTLRARVESLDRDKVRVRDDTPTGRQWLDDALNSLADMAGPKGEPVRLTRWLLHRRKLRNYRDELVDNGLLRRGERTALLVFQVDCYWPDNAVRGSLIDSIRSAARGRLEIDGRLAIRCALVYTLDIDRALGFDRAEMKALGKIAEGDGVSEAVQRILAAARASITVAHSHRGAGGASDGGAAAAAGGGM